MTTGIAEREKAITIRMSSYKEEFGFVGVILSQKTAIASQLALKSDTIAKNSDSITTGSHFLSCT
ncbi:MAG: hypothetical protein DRR19_00495 [Candidatus Parabeggiatoa sp. nov. 1]|nr:MAG: hypothetical protein DRR19_00495 [Gammaproteobacteria bacterium]